MLVALNVFADKMCNGKMLSWLVPTSSLLKLSLSSKYLDALIADTGSSQAAHGGMRMPR